MRDADGNAIKWEKVGDGAYNNTYISEGKFPYIIDDERITQRWVMKIPKNLGDQLLTDLNDAQRATRVWNLLNPENKAAFLPHNQGWIAPYLGDKAPTDVETAKKLVAIYRDTQRIVLDGCGKGNMLKSGKHVFCVDVDMAYHRLSPASSEGYRNLAYDNYWNDYFRVYHMPMSVSVIKTLLYIDDSLPARDIINDYITLKAINRLNVFRLNDFSLNKDTLQKAAELDDEAFNEYAKTQKPKASPKKMTTRLVRSSHPIHTPKPKPVAQDEEDTYSDWERLYWPCSIQ